MRSTGSRAAVAIAAVVLLSGLIWWLLSPRPSLEGAAERIDSGRFKAAESQLRDYLKVYPDDESARIMLAKVLVGRSEREPEAALELVGCLKPLDSRTAARARAIEGDAHFWAGRYDRAELAWLEALLHDPKIPEVGWKLLDIYALQGRDDEARVLALRLFAVEPDRRDRVQLLLQMIRHDAHRIDASSIVHELEPLIRANPGDIHSSMALGQALIRSGRLDEGLKLLQEAVKEYGDRPEFRAALLDGLIEAAAVEEVARVLEGLPTAMADSPAFDLARGWLAYQHRDLDQAAKSYRRAFDFRPSDSSLAYRYKATLRQLGRDAELAEVSARLDAIARFPDVARDLFDSISQMPDLGLKSHPEIFGKAAEALRRIGRKDEAEAWASLPGRAGGGLP